MLARVEQERFEQHAFAVEKDRGAALELRESPALAASRSSGANPIDEHKGGVLLEMKFLALFVDGASETLHGVWHQREHRAGRDRGVEIKSTRVVGETAVDFGGGLR